MEEDDDLNLDLLLKALDNEDNDSLMSLDIAKIQNIKNNILEKLGLKKKELDHLKNKLLQYRYVDELPDIKYGSYIRWISLRRPDNIKLTNGGFICDILVNDTGIHLKCRNGGSRFFQISMSENLIFQKLTEQEIILLSVIDYLNEED